MPSALIYIDPDTIEGFTTWVDPVLSKSSPSRSELGTALLAYIEDENAQGHRVDKCW